MLGAVPPADRSITSGSPRPDGSRVVGPVGHRREPEQLPGPRARIGKTGRVAVARRRAGAVDGPAASVWDRRIEAVAGSGGAAGGVGGAVSEHGGRAGRRGGAPARAAPGRAAPADRRGGDGWAGARGG